MQVRMAGLPGPVKVHEVLRRGTISLAEVKPTGQEMEDIRPRIKCRFATPSTGFARG